MSGRGRRVGLLGGTFDPVHAGHLVLARECARALSLDEVRFLVNARPPHKAPACAAGVHRHAMVALATAGIPDFVADPRELDRPGPSYTIDTVEALLAEEPGSELALLVGADTLGDLRSWRRHDDLVRLCRVVATGRAGEDLREAAGRSGLPPSRLVLIPVVPPAWSSSALRAALRDGLMPPEGSIPGPVVEYIRKHRLYAERPAPDEVNP